MKSTPASAEAWPKSSVGSCTRSARRFKCSASRTSRRSRRRRHALRDREARRQRPHAYQRRAARSRTARVEEIGRMLGGSVTRGSAGLGARDARANVLRPPAPAPRRKANRSRKAKAKERKRKVDVGRKYLIETFGCQMNFHDSERMAGLLEQAGFEATDEAADADVVVINTCSVRERAEEKLYTRLGRAARAGGRAPGTIRWWPSPAAWRSRKASASSSVRPASPASSSARRRSGGCRCWRSRRSLRAASALLDLNPYDDVTFPLGIMRRSDPVKAYVTIIEGCNEFCSFCVVPYTRGHERMRPKADILAEVREAAANGQQGSAAARPDREPLPGAGRSRRAISRSCSRPFTTSRASTGSALPARIRVTSTRGS